MSWLNPGMLWALLLLGVPIIIHLFYFRRYKKVFFSDIRLLEELKKETNKFSRMRNLLALLMRLLALAALVFAFARPFLNKDQRIKRNSLVSIYIDNSWSMSAHSKDVALLDIAKKKAQEIVDSYSEQNRFQIISNEMKGAQQNILDQKRALEYVDNLGLYNGAFDLGSIYNRQKELIEKAELGSEIYWISDFQKSTTELDFDPQDTLVINAVVVQDLIERNVSIDTAWFLRPDHLEGKNSDLVYTITNHSKQDANAVNLSMLFEDQTRPLGNFDIEGGASLSDTVSIPIQTAGWKQLKLQLKDYPVRFDDELFLSFEVKDVHNILVINHQSNSYISNLFPTQRSIKLMQERPEALDYSGFEKQQLIIIEDLRKISSGLEDELVGYVESGGKLLIFPNAGADLDNYNSLLRKLNAGYLAEWEEGDFEVLRINENEELFKGVFRRKNRNMNLPNTKGRFKLLGSSNPYQISPLDYRDGKSNLMRSDHAAGQVFVSSTPLSLEYNDLVRNGDIFVPILYNMATMKKNAANIYYTLGDESEFSADIEGVGNESPYSLLKGSNSFIPLQRRLGKKVYISVGRDINEAGFYSLDNGTEVLKPKLAINYSRKESDLKCYSSDELKSNFEGRIEIIDAEATQNLSKVIESRDSSTRLWKYLLIIALIFLLAEAILLRMKA